MAMPRDLILIRHGESEGNVALNRSKTGDDSLLTPEFLARHSSRWRLSPKGREQAVKTGQWLRENFPAGFDRYYTSEYARALETSGLLDLPDADWFISPYLRERSWGMLDRMSYEERKQLFSQTLADRRTTPYYWRPPNGEAIVDVCARQRPILSALHRDCEGGSAILVCHGEVMEAFSVEIERLPEHAYLEREKLKQEDPSYKIRNCQIIHYSRLADPDSASQVIEPHFRWRRSLRPCDDFFGDWRPIDRARYSNQQLLDLVACDPPVIA